MSESWRVCITCGRQLEVATGQTLVEALSGWYILSRIRERDYFDRTSFCSLECLSTWAKSQQTDIPDIFRRSFDDGLVR